ncbi:hypothetical protein BDB00DRAFT_786487 [Zychaea mexicana]|uniref:uncharacterized protein n=1 Tax=Zychaea mexicana TaxID=64656 RepID=UPI0022FE2BF0|nr:uncharacterized protein BDB00DRAFT_786487 [Zychaea mexicana]KAI9495433.1 hypothetical protein BDB00DRAFT_786487 [Zychaea mexicana]
MIEVRYKEEAATNRAISEGVTYDNKNYCATKAVPVDAEIIKDADIPASWKNVPPICRFCTEEGHRKLTCPKLASIECCHCHATGHYQSYCPTRRRKLQEERVQQQTKAQLLDSFSQPTSSTSQQHQQHQPDSNNLQQQQASNTPATRDSTDTQLLTSWDTNSQDALNQQPPINTEDSTMDEAVPKATHTAETPVDKKQKTSNAFTSDPSTPNSGNNSVISASKNSVQTPSRDADTPLPANLPPWGQFLLDRCVNCLYRDASDVLVPRHAATAFTRGASRTTIDYIFASRQLQPRIMRSHQQMVSHQWTDHDLLSVDLRLDCMPLRPGTWRFNPLLLEQDDYRSLLDTTIDAFISQLDMTSLSVVQQWDCFKEVLAESAKQFGRKHNYRTKRRLQELQHNRRLLLHQHRRAPTMLHTVLPPIEQEIARLQEQKTKQLLLRTATRWHEKALFSREPVNQSANDQLLHHIPSNIALADAQRNRLTTPFSHDELLLTLKHSPLGKSLDLDGIPFEVYRFCQEKPEVMSLLLSVMNSALQEGQFP